MTTNILRFDLSNPEFSGLGRRKYTEKYTKVPVEAYPPVIKDLVLKLYSVLKLELNDETNTLTVVASDSGYAQRIVGPRVYKKGDGENQTLVIKVNREEIEVKHDISEDDVVTYKVNGKVATIVPLGDAPALQINLGNKQLAQIPFYTNRKDNGDNPTFSEFTSAVDFGDYTFVGEAKAGGGSSLFFSHLKNLPVGLYAVQKTYEKAGGKFGPKIKINVTSDQDLTLPVSQTNETGAWEIVETLIPAGSTIVVEANTSLAQSLMGITLKAEDNVRLDILGHREKDNKIIVEANFDYEESTTLGFEF